jgi:hypothetical protein
MAGGEQSGHRTSYEFAYGVGAACKIKALDLPARVTSISITQVGVQYECRYFCSSEHKFAFLFEEEIEALPCKV